MYGIRYLVLTSKEFVRQSREIPQANAAFFGISRQRQELAIKKAEAQWETKEVQDSLEKERKDPIYTIS